MNTQNFISFLCSRGFGCERGVLLLYDLPEVKHSVKPVVHHFNGCEKDRHRGRVHARNHQAGGESLRRSEEDGKGGWLRKLENAARFKKWATAVISIVDG